MFDDGQLFRDMTLNGKPLSSCELSLECNGGQYRLYVDKEDNCFYSLAVSFVSCVSDGDIWECNELRVEQLFNSIAYYDGIRHLEFNRDAGEMAGYIFYPNVKALADMLYKLRKIELEVCKVREKEDV